MPESTVALQILLILLPGFVSIKIIDMLATRKTVSIYDKIINALILSLFIYASYLLLSKIPRIDVGSLSVKIGGTEIAVYGINLLSISIIGFLAVGLGTIIGLLLEKGWLYGLMGKIRLTTKTGRISVWHDVFHEYRKIWVVVHLDDGTRIRGWPDYYSEELAHGPQLFLKRAVFIDKRGKEIPVDGPGILILPEARIIAVEVLEGVEVQKKRSKGERGIHGRRTRKEGRNQA